MRMASTTDATTANGTASIKSDPSAKPARMPVIAENVPQLLLRKDRWLGWRWEWDKNKWTKPPIDIRRDRLGKSTDPTTWCDFATALRAAEGGFVDGIGFALGDGFAGIDFDNCRNRITGSLSPVVGACINRLDTYGEISPSGEGVKLIVQGALPKGRRASGNVEMYDRGRYFTVTGHRLEYCRTEPAPRDEVLAALHAELIDAPQHTDTARRESGVNDRELATSALAGLSPARADDYHDWVAVGMALHSVSTDLLGEWDSWSQSSAKYSAGQCAAKWASFGSGSGVVSLGTLIYWAKQNGWNPPRRTSGRKKRRTWQQDAARASGANGQVFVPRPLTDYGNAERFVEQHGAIVRYVATWDKWIIWDGTRWKLDTTQAIVRLAKKTVRTIYAEVARLAKQTDCSAEDLEELTAWAKASERRERITALIALAASEADVAIDHEVLDLNPWILNCTNGTVDMRTGELQPHNPNDLITKSTNHEYPTEAGEDAPAWSSFLDSTFLADCELIDFLGRLVGYAAVGVIQEHVLPILYGTGSNGKTTFLNAILDVLGDYGFQAPQGFLMLTRGETHPTELTDLFGRRFVSIAETQDGQRLDEGLVKMLTGGERIRARRMREDFWEFKPSHTPFLATNYKPVVRGTDYGIWRRLLLIPFGATFVDPSEAADHPDAPLKDRELPEKLKAESCGILRWIVQGCLRWQREGLNSPDRVRAATGEYRDESDTFKRWFADCCEIEHGAEWRASFAYVKYKTWCEESGEHYLSRNKFAERIDDAGFDRKRTRDGVIYYGFRPLSGD